MLLAIYGWEAMREIKIPVQRTLAENVGGTYMPRRAYMQDTMVYCWLDILP